MHITELGRTPDAGVEGGYSYDGGGLHMDACFCEVSPKRASRVQAISVARIEIRPH